MTAKRLGFSSGLLCSLALLTGCDGQQYVSPDTVALSITNDATGIERVHRCHYIPVLLGSRIEARYSVESDIRVTIRLTREELRVTFDEPGVSHDPFIASATSFDDLHEELVSDVPDGYTVRLIAPCTPEDELE